MSARIRLSEQQRLNWLRLIRTQNVGPATFRDLINRFGSAEAALEALPELRLAGGASRPQLVPSKADAEREMATAQRFGARFVAIGEPDYPRILQHMDMPPPLLAIKGNAGLFHPPAVSIVGARNASATGARMARILAAGLGQEGYAIVSGLARGIDAAVHEASLATGTIAVMAGGLDRLYPPENAALSERIAAQGVLVSEMPFGHQPRARDFPRRNRLVAGLGLGLVVVEAARRSGSLISARLAGEMGRLVFAVPGSPLDPRAAGANSLLQDGAILVTQTSDITEALSPLSGGPPVAPMVPLREPPTDFSSVASPAQDERAAVIAALGPSPTEIDELLRHCALTPAQLAMVLLELDLAGRLERHSGGAVSLIPGDS